MSPSIMTLFFLLLSLVAIHGCRPTGEQRLVSLSEAQKITTRMGGEVLAPPPTITDITAILDQEKPAPQRGLRMKALADKAEPSGLDSEGRLNFFSERAAAARTLGRSAQEQADIKEALHLAEPQAGPAFLDLLRRLSRVEIELGHVQEGMHLRQQQAELLENMDSNFGMLAGAYTGLIHSNDKIGDIESAKKWLVKLRDILEFLRKKKKYVALRCFTWVAGVPACQRSGR